MLIVATGFASLVFSDQAPAQKSSASAPAPISSEQIPIELFQAPRPKKMGTLVGCRETSMEGSRTKPAKPDKDCQAWLEVVNGREGWVEFNFMVDTSGKPFEIAVTQSSGDELLDQAATSAVSTSVFEPGSLNGKPVESDYALKYVFRTTGSDAETGAGRTFVTAYKSLMDSIRSGDRAAADAAMKGLQITNLYEDAYFGVATYTYAQKWGTEAEQLVGLKRAIAYETKAKFLPSDMFRSVLIACFRLELKANQYGEAAVSWKSLQKFGIDASTQALLKPFVDQLEKIRSDSSEYAISGQLTKGSWRLRLFKRHFRAAVDEGYISQVKLRCEKRYVFFAFNPTLQYEVSGKDGDCFLELDGAPGTTFQLLQF